ncbi:hypothetical protein ACF0H5_024053 [Mactra antiquata]
MKIFFKLVVIFCGLVYQASGHGRMMDPVARASAWRLGYPVPQNYDDNALFCGGFANKQAHGGKCGVCGDPWNGRRENEAGGKYATGTIVKTYKMGQVVTLKSEITANHFGWMEYRICPNNDVTKPVTQDCLDQHVLQRADGQGTKVMLNNRRTGMWPMDYVLPAGMTCTQCVIQWKYHAGNSWGVDPKSGRGCVGCGPQEEFYGCADVSIMSDSAPVVMTNAPITQAPTTKAPVVITNRPVTQRPVTQRPATQQPVYQTQTPKEFIGAKITGCVAINNWAGDKQMDQWCTDNCFAGSCPAYACDCSGGINPTTKTTTTTTTTTTPKPTTPKPTTPTTKSTTTTTTTTTTPRPTTQKPTTPQPTTPKPTTAAPATQQPQMTTLDPNVQVINRVECKAVNLWQGNEYLDRWCADACAHGNCPPEQCKCVKVQRYITKTTTTTEIPEPLSSTPNPAVVQTKKDCEAISVWKGISVFDMWCNEQCNDPDKLCPADTCLCRDVPVLPGKLQTTKRPTTSTPSTTTTTTTKKPDVPSYTTCASNGVVAGDYWNSWCQHHCDGGFCAIDYCNCQ